MEQNKITREQAKAAAEWWANACESPKFDNLGPTRGNDPVETRQNDMESEMEIPSKALEAAAKVVARWSREDPQQIMAEDEEEARQVLEAAIPCLMRGVGVKLDLLMPAVAKARTSVIEVEMRAKQIEALLRPGTDCSTPPPTEETTNA